MKKLNTIIISISFMLFATFISAQEIKVAVFQGNGAAQGCVQDAVEAIKIDKDMSVSIITSADIISGALKNYQVLILPGGGGSRQMSDLGYAGCNEVKSFIKNGGGIVGICAGAYMLSSTPDYLDLELVPIMATDIENDHRGRGIMKYKVTKNDLKFFPELKDCKENYLYYYEGPLFKSTKESKGVFCGEIISDVSFHNTPKKRTVGKPLFYACDVEKGRAFLSVCHPETTPGMRWMIPRMARWVIKKDLKSYPSSVVRLKIYDDEVLFDKELRKEESKLLKTLLNGSDKEKISALKRLVKIHSWDSRRYFKGLLREKNFDVVSTAAWAICEIGYTRYIKDLEATIKYQKFTEKQKEELNSYLKKLKSMVNN